MSLEFSSASYGFLLCFEQLATTPNILGAVKIRSPSLHTLIALSPGLTSAHFQFKIKRPEEAAFHVDTTIFELKSQSLYLLWRFCITLPIIPLSGKLFWFVARLVHRLVHRKVFWTFGSVLPSAVTFLKSNTIIYKTPFLVMSRVQAGSWLPCQLILLVITHLLHIIS